MTRVTRRSVIVAAAASAAAAPLAVTSASRAAAPVVGKQAPGYYRYKIGEYEITAVSDGARTGKLEPSFVQNAKIDDIQAQLESLFMPKNEITVVFNPTLVNTGQKLVLLDSGNGPGRGATVGMLAANLAAAGVEPKAIDIVVISHFHADHISGLRTSDGALAFPNAEIKVPAREWAYWTDDAEMSKAPQGSNLLATHQNVRRVFGAIADKVTKYEWDKEVGPGITAVATPGHTPGHTSFAIASGSGKLLVQSDVTAGGAPIFVRNPGWHSWADQEPVMAEATRRKLYDMVATEKLLISGYHFPFPSVGYIEKDSARYRFVPLPWNPVI
jgi:glyoxylase-like metal-dependent hydrolase (beta-lactamase superfamily II)